MSEEGFIDWKDLEDAGRRVLFVVHVRLIVCEEHERRESSEIRFGDQLRRLLIVSFYVFDTDVVAVVDLLHILLQRVTAAATAAAAIVIGSAAASIIIGSAGCDCELVL